MRSSSFNDDEEVPTWEHIEDISTLPENQTGSSSNEHRHRANEDDLDFPVECYSSANDDDDDDDDGDERPRWWHIEDIAALQKHPKKTKFSSFVRVITPVLSRSSSGDSTSGENSMGMGKGEGKANGKGDGNGKC